MKKQNSIENTSRDAISIYQSNPKDFFPFMLDFIVTECGFSGFGARLFDLIIEELQTKNMHYTTACSGLLIQFLSIIAQKISISLRPPGIKRAIAAIRSEYRSDQNIDFYAQSAGYSRYHFIHLFKEATGQSPIKYRIHLRLENACSLLRSTSYSIHEIAEAVGFSDPAYFSRLFKKHLGKSPQSYRKEFEVDGTQSEKEACHKKENKKNTGRFISP